MSSPTTDDSSDQGQTKNASRTERRREWWSKNKDFKSKLRDRTTLSKKENEQQPQTAVPKVDPSRGFRSTVVAKMAAAATTPPATAAAKVKKSPMAAKPHSQPPKQRMGAVKVVPKPQQKSDRVLKKKLKIVPKPPAPKSKAEKIKDTVKPEMSEISMNARGVELTNAANHIPQRYILFVGNLPYSINKGQLMVHFRKTGGVKHVRIPKDKSGNGKGFAYIEFKDRISHGIALRLHHTTLEGRKINVEFSTSESKKKGQANSETS